MELTLNSNDQIDFKDTIFKKFDAIPEEDALKEIIKDYRLKYPQESGNVRPTAALACLRQQIKMKLGSDSDIAKELNNFTKTFNQNEIEQLYSVAPDFFDDLRYEILKYYEDFERFLNFFDGSLIKDKIKFEAFLLHLEPDIWGYGNWFWIIRKLISIKYEKTEELVIKTIKDVERFRGNAAEDYFKSSFYSHAFDLCNEHNFKSAKIKLFKEVGGYHFYADYYVDEGIPPCWDKSYAPYFEEGYRDTFYDYKNNEKDWLGYIHINKSYFSNNTENKKMFKKIDEHNSAKETKYIEDTFTYKEGSERNLCYQLYSNEDFYALDEMKQSTIRTLITRNLKSLEESKIRIPLNTGYAILSKTYLKDAHSGIYKSSELLNSSLIALMEKIVLAVYLGKDYKDDAKLLLDQISSFNKAEKNYFKHLFLTEGSGIRDPNIISCSERNKEDEIWK